MGNGGLRPPLEAWGLLQQFRQLGTHQTVLGLSESQ